MFNIVIKRLFLSRFEAHGSSYYLFARFISVLNDLNQFGLTFVQFHPRITSQNSGNNIKVTPYLASLAECFRFNEDILGVKTN